MKDSGTSRAAASTTRTFRERLRAYFLQTTSPLGLAVFRLMYTTVLFCEVAELFYFRHLVFDPIPYVLESEISYTPVLIAWLVTLVFLLFGLFTTTACVVNYVLTLLTFSAFHTYEYHIDYIYTGVNLLLIFAPVSERLSFDALRRKLAEPAAALRENFPRECVSILFYDALILVGIALIYFDSVFYKMKSPMWTSGLGVWLPASLPHVGWLNIQPLLDQEWLMLFLGYTTLIFETVFLFVMWWRRSRFGLFCVGLPLHLAIALVFPIRWFGLAVASIYFLLLPGAWFEWVFAKLRVAQPRMELFFDPNSPAIQRWLVVLKHFDWRNAICCSPLQHAARDNGVALAARRGDECLLGADALNAALIATGWLAPLGRLRHWSRTKRLAIRRERNNVETSKQEIPELPAMLVASSTGGDQEPLVASHLTSRLYATVFFATFMFCVQMLIVLYAPFAETIAKATGTDAFRRSINRWFEPYRPAARIAFGTTSHPVFMDGHFNGYDHIVGVAYRTRWGEEVWLPIIDENGSLGAYNTGRYFVRWSWRANGPNVRMNALEQGIRDFTAFWARRNHINLINAEFTVYVKRIDPPKFWKTGTEHSSGWEPGYYQTQRDKPWQVAGKAVWSVDGVYSATIRDIESF